MKDHSTIDIEDLPENAVIVYGAASRGDEGAYEYEDVVLLAKQRREALIDSELDTLGKGAKVDVHDRWQPSATRAHRITVCAVVSFTRPNGNPYKPAVVNTGWIDLGDKD